MRKNIEELAKDPLNNRSAKFNHKDYYNQPPLIFDKDCEKEEVGTAIITDSICKYVEVSELSGQNNKIFCYPGATVSRIEQEVIQIFSKFIIRVSENEILPASKKICCKISCEIFSVIVISHNKLFVLFKVFCSRSLVGEW